LDEAVLKLLEEYDGVVNAGVIRRTWIGGKRPGRLLRDLMGLGADDPPPSGSRLEKAIRKAKNLQNLRTINGGLTESE
jgi:hypothetical protein